MDKGESSAHRDIVHPDSLYWYPLHHRANWQLFAQRISQSMLELRLDILQFEIGLAQFNGWLVKDEDRGSTKVAYQEVTFAHIGVLAPPPARLRFTGQYQWLLLSPMVMLNHTGLPVWDRSSLINYLDNWASVLEPGKLHWNREPDLASSIIGPFLNVSLDDSLAESRQNPFGTIVFTLHRTLNSKLPFEIEVIIYHLSDC